MSQFNVDRANAEEFFEVYKGVVKEYSVSTIPTVSLYNLSISTVYTLSVKVAKSCVFLSFNS